MTRGETIAQSIDAAQDLLRLFGAGFDDASRTSQTPNLPNHFAWTLGHCALTMHEVAHFLDGKPLPESDFAPPGDLREGRFVEEEVSYASTPIDDPSRYPQVQRCFEMHDRACARFIDALREAGDAELDRMVPWGSIERPVGVIAQRMAIHTGMHIGQLIDLRRALGIAPLFPA